MEQFIQDKQANPYNVQVLDRAIDILRCFTFETRELRLLEIAEKTRLKKTTAKRLVAHLTARNFLRQEPQSKRYKLGLALFELGGIVFSSFSIRETAKTYMTYLHEETQGSVLLGLMMDDQLVYVDSYESHKIVHISPKVGSRKPLHHGMLGMVLMAHLNDSEINRILKMEPLRAYTPFSIIDNHAFMIRLEKIRTQGFVIEKEETYEGVIGIAAPIRDYTRKVVAVLGVGIYATRANTTLDFERLIGLVKKTCEDISADLGYLLI